MVIEVGTLQNITKKTDKKEVKRISVEEIVKQVVPEKKVSKLIELGVLSDLESYTWGSFNGRFYVFANVKGVPVPMYRSLFHTGGKRKDVNFFPFFGIQEHKKKTWIIKELETNRFSGVPELEDISKTLTSVFDFDVNGYVPEGKEVRDYERLNTLLYLRFGVDFAEINKLSRMSHEATKLASSKILKSLL